MRRLEFIVSLLVLVLFVAVPGCAGRRSGDVLVVLKTKRYHTERCPRVRMANTRAMTVAEARGMSCAPCPGCAPRGAE